MSDIDARLWEQNCPHCAARCYLILGELRCPVCRHRLDWGVE